MDLQKKTIAELKAIQKKGWEASREIDSREKDFAWCLKNIKDYKIKNDSQFINFIFEIEGERKEFYCAIDKFELIPF